MSVNLHWETENSTPEKWKTIPVNVSQQSTSPQACHPNSDVLWAMGTSGAHAKHDGLRLARHSDMWDKKDRHAQQAWELSLSSQALPSHPLTTCWI